jgi:excisionase family DNA binding protein
MTTNTETLLTVAEAAAMLGVSVRTIDRLRDTGQIGCTRIGGGVRPRVYYRQVDVLAYLRRVTTPVNVPPRQAS